ncbi:MAG: hypothetical protein GX053_06180 [Tissierella sp.]|nr:hypothetical protein [Tissierella sp.]
MKRKLAKKTMVIIITCFILICTYIIFNNYNRRPSMFIINDYLFVVNKELSLNQIEVEDYKGNKVGETKKQTIFFPKNDYECFKCPVGSSIFLVNNDKLLLDDYYKNRFSETKGYDLLLINIENKYYISKLVVANIYDNYWRILEEFSQEFYKKGE